MSEHRRGDAMEDIPSEPIGRTAKRSLRSGTVVGMAGFLVLGALATAPLWSSLSGPEETGRAVGDSGCVAFLHFIGDVAGTATREPGETGPADPGGEPAPAGRGAADAAMRGAQVAVEAHNALRGACRFVLRPLDTDGDPQRALRAARQSADDGSVIGVIGPFTSAEVLAAAPVLEAAGLPFVSPGATDPSLSTKGWKMFHRTIGTQADAGRYAAYDGGTGPAFVVARGPAPTGFADAARAELVAGGDLAGAATDGVTAATTLAATIEASGADRVIYEGDPAYAIALRRALDSGIGLTVDETASTPALAKAPGADDTTAVLAGRDGSTTNATFQEAYGQAAPERFAAEGHDAVVRFSWGYLSDEPVDRSGADAVLDGALNSEGAGGTVTFQPDGDLAGVAPVVTYTVVDGAFTRSP